MAADTTLTTRLRAADAPGRELLTVAEWNERQNGEEATPACPHCGRRLSIRLGMWRENGRDAWLCDHDGEFERV